MFHNVLFVCLFKFEMENQRLFTEMNSLVNEVRYDLILSTIGYSLYNVCFFFLSLNLYVFVIGKLKEK